MITKKMMRYTTADRTEYIYLKLNHLGLSRTMIKQILQADAQCIREILLDGNDVYISDVGAIKIAYQHPVEERVGRNPYTGESLTIPYTPEYNKVTFTTNRNLKKELKEKTLGAAFVPDRNNKKKVKDAEEE